MNYSIVIIQKTFEVQKKAKNNSLGFFGVLFVCLFFHRKHN